MGALHEGHLALVKKCKSESELSIVSIFVNPTQFNDNKDLEKYPNNIEADLKFLEQVDVDIVFIPKFEDLYRNEKIRLLLLLKLNKNGGQQATWTF